MDSLICVVHQNKLRGLGCSLSPERCLCPLFFQFLLTRSYSAAKAFSIGSEHLSPRATLLTNVR